MTDFRRLTYFLGLFSFFLLFAVSAFLFVGFVEKQSIPVENVNFKVREKAQALDIWRFAKNGKYRIKARSMVKKDNGVIELTKAQLWVYKTGEPVIYLKADEAYVYPNHNIKANGHVFLKRNNLVIRGISVTWNDKSQIILSKKPFNGSNPKSKFKGKSFVYCSALNKLVAHGVDVWLK